MGKKGRIKRQTSLNQREREEAQMRVIAQVAFQSRVYALQRLIGELFEVELDGKTMRLRGLGAPTGVITIEKMNEIARGIALEGVKLEREDGGDGEPQPGDDGVGSAGQAEGEGHPQPDDPNPRERDLPSAGKVPLLGVGSDPRPDPPGINVGT